MLYKRFEIKNFRGIHEVVIDLANNRIITLVGLNESGKTTVMEAMSVVYQVIKGNQPSLEKLNQFRPKGIAFTGSIEIAATLLLEAEDKKRINDYWKKDSQRRKVLEVSDELRYMVKFNFHLHTYQDTKTFCEVSLKREGSTRSLYQTGRTAWQRLIDFIKSEIVPEILYYDDFIFEIPERIVFARSGIPEDEEVKKKNNKTWQLVISDVLRSVDSRMMFQEHVVDKWEDDRDAASNRLAQMKKALNDKITSRWGELFSKSKVNFREITIDAEYLADRLYLSFNIRTQAEEVFLVNERSKGFKWFFSFLLFTEFRKKRTKNILFLVDEPASNLHSSAQAKILDALSELSRDSLVIYSTHSHHLVNPDWLAGAYVCINENLSNEILSGNLNLEEGATISAIKYYTYVGRGLGSDRVSYFQPILDRLDYKPSTVEPVPDIIILEGKNDWYTLRYFEQIILRRDEKLNFYPGGGRDKLYDIIRLYLAWGKSFVVLLDGDDGVKSKQKYLKEFGGFLDGRVFTIRDVLNKSEAIEGLIGVMDQKRIYDQVYGAGSYDALKAQHNPASRSYLRKVKENLNYAINQLYIQRIEVEVHKGTSENFQKLLDFLQKRLSALAVPHPLPYGPASLNASSEPDRVAR